MTVMAIEQLNNSWPHSDQNSRLPRS